MDENKMIFYMRHTIDFFVEPTIIDHVVQKGSFVDETRLLRIMIDFMKEYICSIHIFLDVISCTMHL
jgi:hypothetical protein